MADHNAGAKYDRKITSAETAARMEREQGYKDYPQQEGSDFDTTSGYTVDREGLANNFPIETEPYVEVPGDLREKNQQQ